MAEVKFNINTLDKDTGILYPQSDEFVSVSDAFAERLKQADKKGENYEFAVVKEKPKKEDK
jgi:hypothetical protein